MQSHIKFKKLISHIYLNAISAIVATRGNSKLLGYREKDANILNNSDINFEAISNDLGNSSNLKHKTEMLIKKR